MPNKRKFTKRLPPGGRVSKLDDPKFVKELLGIFRKGVTKNAACAAMGIGRDAVTERQKKDPEFAEKLRIAQGKGRVDVEAKMFIQAVDEGDVTALKFILERLHYKDWGLRRPDAWTLKDIVCFGNRLGQELAAALPFELQVAARAIIDKNLEMLLLGERGGGNGK